MQLNFRREWNPVARQARVIHFQEAIHLIDYQESKKETMVGLSIFHPMAICWAENFLAEEGEPEVRRYSRQMTDATTLQPLSFVCTVTPGCHSPSVASSIERFLAESAITSQRLLAGISSIDEHFHPARLQLPERFPPPGC